LWIFIALVMLSAVTSDHVARSVFGESLQHQGALTAVLYAGFFYTPRLLDVNERWVLRTFAAIVLGAVAVSAYAVVQRGGVDPLWGDAAAGARAFSSIGQPNGLAAYLVIAITLALALGIWAGRANRWLLVAVLGLMVFALALTESRGGMLGLAAAVCSVAFLSMRSSDHSAVRDPFIRATILLGLVAFMFVLAHMLERAGLFAGGDRQQSMQNHIDVWRVALAVTRDRPLLGIGPETFGDHFHSYSPKVLSPERQWYFGGFRVESPHNAMLGVSSGSGLPALAALLVVIAAMARRLLRLMDSTCDRLTRVLVIGILAAAFGHLVTDSFMTPEIAGSWLFWLLLGVGAQLVIRSDSNTNTRSPRA
jgi:O-antigen ligase